MTVQELALILRAGGGLVIEGSGMTYGELVNLAQAAKDGGGQITMWPKHLTPQQRVLIAQAAPGRVTFDLTR